MRFLSRIILTSAIGICSVIGDQGLKYGKTAAMRAFFDNITHATVGGLTWSLILVLSQKSVVQNLQSVFLCFFLSSFIDIDHFIAAGSWKLNDATHLQKRPFLHCTTLPIAAWLVISLSSVTFNQPKLFYFSWIIPASFLSHHIRDATRRGLWFCPIGSTQPIPYYLYLIISMALPYILQWLMSLYVPRIQKNATVIDII